MLLRTKDDDRRTFNQVCLMTQGIYPWSRPCSQGHKASRLLYSSSPSVEPPGTHDISLCIANCYMRRWSRLSIGHLLGQQQEENMVESKCSMSARSGKTEVLYSWYENQKKVRWLLKTQPSTNTKALDVLNSKWGYVKAYLEMFSLFLPAPSLHCSLPTSLHFSFFPI